MSRLLTAEKIVAIVEKHGGDLVKMWNTEVVEGTLSVDSCMNYVLKAQRDLTASKYQQKIEEIFEEIERVSQDIDEDGKSTDDPAKVIETIYYIGKGRLRDFKDRIKKEEK